MVTHHMMEKRVSWNILEKVKLGKTVHYIRRMRFGVVKDVSQCGNLCLVIDDIGNRYEIETPELDTLDQQLLFYILLDRYLCVFSNSTYYNDRLLYVSNIHESCCWSVTTTD